MLMVEAGSSWKHRAWYQMMQWHILIRYICLSGWERFSCFRDTQTLKFQKELLIVEEMDRLKLRS